MKVHWSVENLYVDFDFSRALEFLRPLREDDLFGIGSEKVEEKWKAFLLFCQVDYGNNGGPQPLLGIHETTNEVWALDYEDDSMYFFCSDISIFLESFLVFDAYARLKTLPRDHVEPMLRKIDPFGYDRSEWKMLLGLSRLRRREINYPVS